MAKDRKKLQHIHSSVPDKQPTPQTLEVGEIAVNNAANQEFLSIKSSDNKVKRFSSDEQMITWTELKEVVPYTGQVRGKNYESPSSDSHGSVGITNDDLLNNKSNIVIKMNQVAAKNTPKSEEINGAKDIYDHDVNLEMDGSMQGAGFAIDMSRYAMIDANPSFSSITITHRSNLSGTTNISGKTTIDDNLDVTGNLKVTGTTDITGATTIGGATTINNNLTVTGNTKITGTTDISGTTTIDDNFNVTGKANITGTTTIGGATTINNNLTVTGNTNLGPTTATTISASSISAATISASTIYTTGVFEKKLKFNYESATGYSNDTYDGTVDKTLHIPKDASHIARRKVSWSYGSVTGASGSNYEPGQANDGSFVIPKDLSHITGVDDLKVIEGLTGTNGFLKKTAANSWSLDTNTYSTTGAAATTIYYDNTSGAERIVLKNAGGTELSSIDAKKFIKDGMIDSVSAGTSGSTTVLVIKWNTDAGKEQTIIDIGDMLEVNNYYTKTDLTGSSTNVVVKYASSASTAASAQSVALANVSDANDLKAIEALTGTSGLLKKTAANAWTLDTTSYSSATQVNTALGNKVDKVSGKGLSTNDYTTDEKNKLSGIANGAEVNQNAFSNIKVGSTTIEADGKTDTLEISGSGIVTITADATNDKITISASNAVTSVAGKTGAVTLVKGDVGLGNVDNTADANKTVKAATSAQTADTAKAVALSGVTNADDLKAIEALTGTSGFLKKTAANSWSLDTTTYAKDSDLDGIKLKKITQSEYDALSAKDANTLYIITD